MFWQKYEITNCTPFVVHIIASRVYSLYLYRIAVYIGMIAIHY